MIIVFADDRTVFVLPDIRAVRTECEAVDVEDGVYSFFNELGQRLIPVAVNPVSRTSSFLGKAISGGDFDLRLDRSDDGTAFERAIAEAASLVPNTNFSSVSDLASYVRNNQGRKA
jgi:hypothetical protein